MRKKLLRAGVVFCTMVVALHPFVASAAVVPDSFFGMHFSSARYQPWPTVGFKALRTWGQWDNGFADWAGINTANGVYDWSKLDTIVNAALSHGVDIVYTFGTTPQWASTNPNGTGCAFGPGTCYMPLLAPWETFVRDITQRYKGKIKYWELWNEPNASNFWNGTVAGQVSMAAGAYSIIKNTDPTNVVLSPSPQGTNAHLWLDSYFAAGGAQYTDVVSFHGYLYGAPELITALGANVKTVAAKYPVLAGKPVWDTEHSWGVIDWPFGANPDQRSAWLARFLLLSASSGIERSFWYMWDGYPVTQSEYELWGMLFDANAATIQKPGIAYREVRDWMNGADLTGCTLANGVYQCRLTRSGNYQALAVWAASSNPAFTVQYTVPSSYVRYQTLDEAVVPVTAGATLTLTMKPILLENDPAAGTADTTPPTVPTNLAGTAASSSQINLSWSAASDNVAVTGYKVFRNSVQVATAAGPTYADTGLTPHTAYSYAVSAYDGAGNQSALSLPKSVTTLPVSTVITKGSRVKTTVSTSVRSRASTVKNSKIIGTQPSGAFGTVVNGPASGSGFTWWYVNFDTGADGWVTANSLSL